MPFNEYPVKSPEQLRETVSKIKALRGDAFVRMKANGSRMFRVLSEKIDDPSVQDVKMGSLPPIWLEDFAQVMIQEGMTEDNSKNKKIALVCSGTKIEEG